MLKIKRPLKDGAVPLAPQSYAWSTLTACSPSLCSAKGTSQTWGSDGQGGISS